MGLQENGVYWPFKNLLSGSGIVLTEGASSITIATTGAGPGGGDMLISVFATNGATGVVDKAVSAQTVTGVVAHATLADSVPWAGINGAPTIFPTDWGSIANKPATFTPSPHGGTHVTSDLIPLATLTAVGLTAVLSGKVTDYKAGDGAWHDLNTNVGAQPLTMNAALVCNTGLTVAGGAAITGNLTVTGGATVSAGLGVTGNIQINSGALLINNPSGALSGIYNTGTNNAVFALSNGVDLTHNACWLYKPSGQSALWEVNYNASGAQVYAAEVLTTYNPSGRYAFRYGTQLVGQVSLPGDSTAWSKAAFVSEAGTSGGFGGYGMVSDGYWGCALGAWKTGLWLATSSNTFIQLTDNSGHIVAGALAGGAAQTNLGYAPVNRTGDTMTGSLTLQAANLFLNGNGLISLTASNGYQWAIEASTNGNLYAVRVNDNFAKQLAP
jgi:hypothetical protein